MRDKLMKHGWVLVCTLLVAMLCGCGKKAEVKLPDDVQVQACAHNLDAIASCKKAWADANHKGADDAPTMDDLKPYIRHPVNCPGGGTYTMGKISELPSCSIAAHNEAFKKLLANP